MLGIHKYVKQKHFTNLKPEEQNMRKAILGLIIGLMIIISSSALFADTSSQFINATVPAIYEVEFVSGNYDAEDNKLAANTGEKVGEVTLTCNATSFHFKFYTANAAYINSNTGILLRNGGALINAYDRLAYKVYFANETNVNHTAPGGFPIDIASATTPTDADTGNDFTFTGTQPTTGGTYDLNIVVTEGDLQSALAGLYTSELTIVLSDS